jgi:diphthamide biosynthesis enzyme Dph1/Dph2-like protein
MKTLYIEARKKFDNSKLNLSKLDKLPGKKIALAATIQYIELIPIVKKYLENIGKKVLTKKGPRYIGQVLGCNSSAFDTSADSFLLITDGKFHALNNAIQLNKEIYVFNTNNLEKITRKEIDEYNNKNIAKKKIFLSSDKIGIIKSIKPGQKNNSITSIKNKIEKLNKKAYVFETDNIDFKEFDNFPEIKLWVNTACFGLAQDDKRIINLADILEYLK